MKDIHNNPLFTDISAEGELTVQGGAWYDFVAASGLYIDPDGNPKTANNYYFGSFNDTPTKYPGVTWDLRVGPGTFAKGYGNTFNSILDWAKKRFKTWTYGKK